MRAPCPTVKNMLHPSRTLRNQELQKGSAVFKCEEDLAPLSHIMDTGAPECQRCTQFSKRFGTPLTIYMLQNCPGAPECNQKQSRTTNTTQSKPKHNKSNQSSNTTTNNKQHPKAIKSNDNTINTNAGGWAGVLFPRIEDIQIYASGGRSGCVYIERAGLGTQSPPPPPPPPASPCPPIVRHSPFNHWMLCV